MTSKEAIATVLGCGISDVHKYQKETRLFYVGDVYYTSHRAGYDKLLPTGFTWYQIVDESFTKKYGLHVWQSEPPSKPTVRREEYFEGVYQITPLGPQTAFQCLVSKLGPDQYVLIDLRNNDSLEVPYDLLNRMRPIFIRKHEPKA